MLFRSCAWASLNLSREFKFYRSYGSSRCIVKDRENNPHHVVSERQVDHGADCFVARLFLLGCRGHHWVRRRHAVGEDRGGGSGRQSQVSRSSGGFATAEQAGRRNNVRSIELENRIGELFVVFVAWCRFVHKIGLASATTSLFQPDPFVKSGVVWIGSEKKKRSEERRVGKECLL